jgi:hypothetical protein
MLRVPYGAHCTHGHGLEGARGYTSCGVPPRLSPELGGGSREDLERGFPDARIEAGRAGRHV